MQNRFWVEAAKYDVLPLDNSKVERLDTATKAGDAPPAEAKRQQVYRKVRSLRPHPLQSQLFSDLPEGELRLLAENLQKNGQIDDIEIVSDNQVICGWQRTRAMR